jgi:hypothetical protein
MKNMKQLATTKGSKFDGVTIGEVLKMVSTTWKITLFLNKQFCHSHIFFKRILIREPYTLLRYSIQTLMSKKDEEMNLKRMVNGNQGLKSFDNTGNVIIYYFAMVLCNTMIIFIKFIIIRNALLIFAKRKKIVHNHQHN